MQFVTDSNARPRRWRRLATATLVAGTLVLAACGSSDDGGAVSGDDGSSTTAASSSVLGTKDAAKGAPVAIGFITDGKNPSTDQSIELDVSKAVAKYLNDYKGGIGGRPIALTQCEAKLDPGKGADCANQMVEKKVLAVVVGTTGVTSAVWQPLHDAGIPTLFYAAGDDKISQDATTSFTLSSRTGGTIDLPGGLAKSEGKKTVTAIVIDVPAALPSFQGEGAQEFKSKYGVTVDLIRIAPGTADMTPQLSKLTSGDPGVIYVLGNDSFCISAFQALQNLGVKAKVATIGPCITDATRKAMGGFLEGMQMAAQAPLGSTGEDTALVRAVDKAYGSGWDLSRTAVFGTFEAMAGFGAALHDLSGEITPESIVKALKAMPEMDLPGSGGLKFRCNGKASAKNPAVCVRGTLVATLDATGNAKGYKVLGASPIPD